MAKNSARDWLLGELWVPSRVEIDRDELVWEADLIPDPDPRSRRPPTLRTAPVRTGMIDAFANLIRQDVLPDEETVVRKLDRERVREFAMTYGVFKISPFAIGAGQSNAVTNNGDREAAEAVKLLRQDRDRLTPHQLAILDDAKRVSWRDTDIVYPETIKGREPLALWEGRARQTRAVRSIAKNLHTNVWMRSSREDWHDALCLGTGTQSPDSLSIDARAAPVTRHPQSHVIPDDWYEVQRIVNTWLTGSGVMPHFTWDAPRGKAPTLTLASGESTLYGALAIQLSAGITGAPSYDFCSACGGSFIPRGSKRDGDKRRYCHKPECQKASNRDKQRDKRRRDATANAD